MQAEGFVQGGGDLSYGLILLNFLKHRLHKGNKGFMKRSGHLPPGWGGLGQD